MTGTSRLIDDRYMKAGHWWNDKIPGTNCNSRTTIWSSLYLSNKHAHGFRWIRMKYLTKSFWVTTMPLIIPIVWLLLCHFKKNRYEYGIKSVHIYTYIYICIYHTVVQYFWVMGYAVQTSLSQWKRSIKPTKLVKHSTRCTIDMSYIY